MLLSGIRVLELADELGEYAGKTLAGLGADVVKIEPPDGEATRDIGPFYGDVHDRERSLYFWHYNFGKRSVTLDLDEEADQQAFRRLAARSDVVLDTRERGFLADRGIGCEQLRTDNPGLIYARISPFGDDGPWADYVGSDLVHLALGGVMMNCGYDASTSGDYDTPPIAPQMWHSYHIAGEQTVSAIIAALCYRNVSGSGQDISTAVHQAVSANTEQDIPDWVYGRQPHYRHTGGHSFPQTTDDERSTAIEATHQQTLARAKDGRWLLPYSSYIPIRGTNVSGTGDTIDRLLEVMARHDYRDPLLDDRFYDPEFRRQPGFHDQLTAIIARFVARTLREDEVWQTAQDVGLAWAPVRRPEENLEDPHWRDRGTFIEVEHPGAPPAMEIGAKWVSPTVEWRTGPRSPLIGEHTSEVLADDSPWLRQLPSSKVSAPDSGVRRRHVTVASRHGTPFALAGVRIVDLSWALASAGAGRLFTALGAEVIKVEHHSRIDGMRKSYGLAPDGLREERDAATGPVLSSPTASLNRSGAFMEINSGKRSLSLNLKSDEGKEILRELIREADMVVEGFSPGTFARMGFGYDELKQIRPDIIYVQQSGTGERGRYRRMRTFGFTAQALSGITDMGGLPEPFGPTGFGYSYLDWFGAYHMATSMMAALLHRDRTGKGCWIDSAQVEAGIHVTGTAVLDYSINGRSWQRTGNRSPYKPAAPHGAYRCAGRDRWIAISAFTEDQWRALVRVLGANDLRSDPRTVDLQHRVQNQDWLDAAINDRTREWDAFELMSALQSAAVPAGVCQTAQDRCEGDPQLAHLGWLVELPQSEIGTWPVKENPARMSCTPPFAGGFLGRSGPNYGEDTDEVLMSVLGKTSASVELLRATGVIA